MVSGNLTYSATVPENVFSDHRDDFDDVVKLQSGLTGIQNYDTIEVYINEDGSVQVHWFGMSYKDLSEINYFLEHRLRLPETVNLNELETVRMRLNHRVVFKSEQPIDVDDENIQTFTFENFTLNGFLLDEQTKEYRLSSIEAPIEDVSEIYELYVEFSEEIGTQFTFTEVL